MSPDAFFGTIYSSHQLTFTFIYDTFSKKNTVQLIFFKHFKHSYTYFHILFPHTYIKNTQTTLLNPLYQTPYPYLYQIILKKKKTKKY